ncbi:BCCT family transporter [Luteimonas suaedae]|uniref:BCCT family transporter n=1 Tax=Luteimonas suaedae TaxID=2605430 RepID=UPI0011F049CB|nr:choline BCCT transporter BetT [Luteimonas suaedae]
MNEKTTPAKASWYKINPPVFFTSAILALVFVALGAFVPEWSDAFFGDVQGWVVESAGWFYVLAVAGFLVFVVGLAFSNFGKLKLGPDHSTPDYSYLSWFAMLFSAGMGIGLMFFGVAEPIMHYATPPVGDPETVAAARQAMRVTFFHWGVHAWAIYAVVALSLAYFAFRHGLPLTIRSSLYPLIGERIYGPIGHAVDVFAVLGTLFGVATSLGFGVIQVNAGLNYMFDVPVGVGTQMILIAVITGIATVSVGLGLDAGIRRISELNMILAVALLAFVLIAGPTVYLLQTLVQNTGMYVSNLFSMTFNLYAYEPTGWIGGWTLFYWGWWIAWSPFVGMFIARVSRGRTIREFVTGVLLVPLGFTFMWMTFFGNTALHMVMIDGAVGLMEAVAEDSSVALFQFFELLPLSSITSLVATVLVITFFVTSSDSGSLVVDMLTSGGEEEGPLWQRIFWALVEGAIAAVLLYAGGLDALQAATIASALPFTVVMLLMCWGMIRAMRLEVTKQLSMREARLAPLGATGPVDWKTRLRAMAHHPRRQEVLQFLQQEVRPALEDVAAELKKQGLEARVQDGEDGRVWIEVGHGEEMDFFYSVRPRPYDPPSFAMSDLRRKRTEEIRYFRAEVHLSEGGQDYDIMGWHKDELIHDVLDQYQRHMHFLHIVR